MSYFYLCSYGLSPSTIIEKGNWGRIMRLNNINQNSYDYLIRELIYEKVRLENYNDKPSRFTSAFVCSNLESAREFKRNCPFGIMYEVEPEDSESNSFETDWSLIQSTLNKNIGQVEEIAKRYWQGEITDENKKEILFYSDIRIVKRLSE